jgi:hypothetical protein
MKDPKDLLYTVERLSEQLLDLKGKIEGDLLETSAKPALTLADKNGKHHLVRGTRNVAIVYSAGETKYSHRKRSAIMAHSEELHDLLDNLHETGVITVIDKRYDRIRDVLQSIKRMSVSSDKVVKPGPIISSKQRRTQKASTKTPW